MKLGKRYRLEWCGNDGDLKYEDFHQLVDAVREGIKIRHFFDGVEIVNAETGNPVEL